MSGRRRSRVALTMIVRDDESLLPGCLGSTRGLFDEIVVVDTGSVDGSREVARSFGARVVDYPWCDDFSAARNMAISHCACDSIFWMDADEALSPSARGRLARLLKHGVERNAVYMMYQVSNRLDGSFGFTEIPSPRLFGYRHGVSWSGRVYERILPSLRAAGRKITAVNIHIGHTGFAQASSVMRKLSRNKRLLEIELAEVPSDPRVLFNLAFTHSMMGRCASLEEVGTAQRYLGQMLDRGHDPIDPELKARAQRLQSGNHYYLHNMIDALRICRDGRSSSPTDVGLVDLEAFLLRDLGMWDEAEALYNGLPRIREYIKSIHLVPERYVALVSAKIEAAYYFEEVNKYCKAFAMWIDLARNSAGMFDALPGVRRTARRVLRKAVFHPRAFLDEIGHFR